MGKQVLLGILIIVLLVSGCAEPPPEAPAPASEAAEMPSSAEITEPDQAPFATPTPTPTPPRETLETIPGTTQPIAEEEARRKSPVEQPQVSANTQPADSPWPMFRGNPRHTGLSPYDTSHVDGTVKWTFTVEDEFESSPSIAADGTVYIGSHKNKLYAINPDGTEKWRFDAGDPVYDGKYNVWKGILSSPAIASDGTIYISSLSNFLFAIGPDGREKWRFPLKTSVDTWSSPTIGSDGAIYIGSARDSVGGKIYAINPDGTEKWSFATESDVFPSPAIGDDGTIYAGAGASGKFYAINPDGTEKWHFQTGLHIESSAAIGADGTIYFGSWDNNVYALNPDGTEKWHFVTGGEGIVSSPAIGRDGIIYIVANDNNLYAIKPDGSEKWRLFLGEAIETASSPTIGADGTIYVGFPWTAKDVPTFRAISPDGTGKWTSMTRGGISASPAIGREGTVFISSYNGAVYAFGGSSSEAKGVTTDTSGAIFPACGSEPIFTVSPVDIDSIRYIVPLGNLNPPAHVFPTDHMYFYMDKAGHSRALYSPGDLTVVEIRATEYITAGSTDYSVMLKACDEITVEFGHLNSLSEDVFGDTSFYEDWRLSSEYSTGGETYRLWTKHVQIWVTAGEVLGTVAESRWGNWDFYLLDQRYPPENVANPERWQKRKSLNAVSFLSYYEKGTVFDRLVALIERDKMDGDTTPYGVVMQDVPGTAQGVWFRSGVDDNGPEDPHLALVHSNIHPARAVLSVGDSIPGIDSGFYEFLPKSQDFLNRDFPSITPDGQIYGFQISDQYGKGFDGIIIITMPDAETLWIEALKYATNNPARWIFTGNKTVFKR